MPIYLATYNNANMEVRLPDEASFPDLVKEVKGLFDLDEITIQRYSTDFECLVNLDGVHLPPNKSKLTILDNSNGTKKQ